MDSPLDSSAYARKFVSHAARPASADTLGRPGDDPSPTGDHRVCLVCGRPLTGRRPEATSCSGRCRAALARQRRRNDLVARVHRAEVALREAAEALASLKELAGLDATLEVGGVRGLHGCGQ
jgi:predicted nucleic acid-binding Zn ribbon protein